jgi:acetyl esterase/lipase
MGNQPQRSGRDLVDPKLWPLLDQFPTIVPSDEHLAERRGRQLPQSPADIVAVERTVCRISSAQGAHHINPYCYSRRDTLAPSPAILHIHGGGFIAGSPTRSTPCFESCAPRLAMQSLPWITAGLRKRPFQARSRIV